MENGIKLNLKLSQNLSLSPKLQQALKVLQLGRNDLMETLEKELAENPALEKITRKEPNWEARKKSSAIDAIADNNVSLQSHLASQLRFNSLTNQQEKIVLYITGNIDSNGYLTSSYDEIANACNVEISEVEEVMELFKGLEPAGVGARNLEECLMFQLEHIGLSEELPGKIITKYVNELTEKNWKKIANSENVSENEIKSAIEIIKKLAPEPGKSFVTEHVDYIKPDVYIVKNGEEFVCVLNDEDLPNLKINKDFVNYASKLPKSQKGFVTSHFQSASWLIKSIEQRNRTLLAVTRSLINHQKDFLEFGDSHLKPLTLLDVAKELDLHESTISRVTSNKYAQTPRGLLSLKAFFSNGLSAENGMMSTVAIKDKIKHLIINENKAKPMSDQEISNYLGKSDINIARRTVAKYREGLGFGTASERKLKN